MPFSIERPGWVYNIYTIYTYLEHLTVEGEGSGQKCKKCILRIQIFILAFLWSQSGSNVSQCLFTPRSADQTVILASVTDLEEVKSEEVRQMQACRLVPMVRVTNLNHFFISSYKTHSTSCNIYWHSK